MFACQFLEKVWMLGHSVYVFCNNQQAAETLDELLWSFKEDSFIPHHLKGEGPEPPPPIQIGFETPQGFNDILLNLTDEVPDFSAKFKRIIELVSNEETAKEISRAHFRSYRQKNYTLYTHPVNR